MKWIGRKQVGRKVGTKAGSTSTTRFMLTVHALVIPLVPQGFVPTELAGADGRGSHQVGLEDVAAVEPPPAHGALVARVQGHPLRVKKIIFFC